MNNPETTIEINVYYRSNTEEWVGEVNINSKKYSYNCTAKVTGNTEEEARLCAYLNISKILLDIKFDVEEYISHE